MKIKNRFFRFTRRKNVKSSIAIALSIMALNLNLGCSYYTVAPMEITRENIKSFNEQEKYVVIHSGESIYNLNQMVFNEDDKTITGIAKHLLPQHIYKTKREDKRVQRYKKERQNPLNEVHFYVQNVNFPKMETEVSIPFENIVSVSVNNRNSGRSIANVFTGTIGVFFAVVLIVALTKSSCPFVYIKNGQEYEFTGELYPGIITANMQRDDYLPLPKITSKDGTYELKITNELKEIQYTDLAQLVLIEHSEDIEVLLDKTGKPHTFSNLISPKTVNCDGDNQNIKNISAKDDKFWSFNSTINTLGGTREMVLEFDRPKKSKSAKLYITAKNSVWLDIVFGKFNEQFGSYYNDFQKQQQQLSRGVSEQWIKDQNIPLSISIKTKNGWELVDQIATVGPLAMRNVVIPLKLEYVDSGPLKVKLETGFMFWDVDYVAIDYSLNINLEPRLIDTSLATDENNYEVTGLLRKADGKYLKQPDIGNEVQLTFEIPAPNEHMTQSAFLKNRGYYNYIRDYKGTPDVNRLRSYKEKNAFSKFSESSYLNFVSMENLIVDYDN